MQKLGCEGEYTLEVVSHPGKWYWSFPPAKFGEEMSLEGSRIDGADSIWKLGNRMNLEVQAEFIAIQGKRQTQEGLIRPPLFSG